LDNLHRTALLTGFHSIVTAIGRNPNRRLAVNGCRDNKASQRSAMFLPQGRVLEIHRKSAEYFSRLP
jgi:hypothetical protein